MERQDALNRRANAVADFECNTRLRANLAALKIQAELQEEELLKYKPDVRGR